MSLPARLTPFTRGVGTALSLLLLLCSAVRAADAAPLPTEEGPTSRHEFLPSGDVFRPLLADPREARFSAGLHAARFRSGPVLQGRGRDSILLGTVGAGHTFGLWAWRTRDIELQIGVAGVVLAQFDLSVSTGDLLNADYLVSVPLTLRRGPWSGRLRLLHQSSHVGDELLVRNPKLRVRNFGYEMLEFTLARDLGDWRVYGTAGVVVNSATRFDPLTLQAGAEYRHEVAALGRPLGLVPSFVAGGDLRTWQQQDWGLTFQGMAGFELARPDAPQRVRIVVLGLVGHWPHAQFFDVTRVDQFGLGLQLDL